MADYTRSEYYYYDKTETDLPLFYKPKYADERGQKIDYQTGVVLSWALDDAQKNGYMHLAEFIKEIVKTYDAWRW